MSFHSRIVPQSSFASVAPPTPGILRRLIFLMTLWRQRLEARRCLAQMDARSLRDAGISPTAAAFESGKPFWQKMGGLR